MQTLLNARAFVIVGLLYLSLLLPIQTLAQAERLRGAPEKMVIDDEKGIYAHFYLAYQNKDPIRALGFANKYVKLFPSGAMAAYLKGYVEKNLPEHPDALKKFEDEKMDEIVIKPAQPPAVEETNQNIVEIPKYAQWLEKLLVELIEDGANVDARSNSGYTALMFAAMNGHGPVIKKLLEKGANINFKEASHGYTPLIYAIWTENAETVRLLLENGASKFIKDTEGRNALDHAKLRGSAEIIELIKSFSSKK